MSETARDRPDSADVLLVEDNPGDVRLTREAFSESGLEITLHVVTDGVEALEFVERRGRFADAPRADVVLLDLNLPRMSGLELLDEIKADPELRPIPVVVLTSSTTEEDVVRAYEAHANAYLTKPIDPDAFIETIEAIEKFWLEVVRRPDPN